MALDATEIAAMMDGMRNAFSGAAQSINVEGAWVDALVTRIAAGAIPTEYGMVEGKGATARVQRATLATAGRATWKPKTGDLVQVRNGRNEVTEYRVGLVADHEWFYNLTLSDKVAG